MCLCVCKHHSYWELQRSQNPCSTAAALKVFVCVRKILRICVCFPVTSKNMEGGGFVFVNINQISWESIVKKLKIISTVQMFIHQLLRQVICSDAHQSIFF